MKVYRRLNFYKYLFSVLSCLLLFVFISILGFFVLKIITTRDNGLKDFTINTELLVKPIIQINDSDNNLTYIVSKNGLIQENYTKITLYDLKLKNDFFEAYSKEVVYYNDELILKDRPNILFYNNR